MARVEGFYWVRERDEGSVIIAAFRGGEWTFGDGDGFTDESNIIVITGPLMPPSADQAAGWQDRYQQLLSARKAAGQKDPTGGWDWLDGYYWVRAGNDPTPVLAQYFEGWGEAAGEREFNKVEIVDGPLIPPQVTERRVA